jgi:hypothetical protein
MTNRTTGIETPFWGEPFPWEAGVTVSDLLQWGTLFVGGVGIGVALINQRRQLNAQMFIEFSKRFEELLRLFPTEAWLANRRPHQELPPSSKEITECTLYCLQFVADVYHLHKAGYISNRLWSLWEREIKRTLKGASVRAGVERRGSRVFARRRIPGLYGQMIEARAVSISAPYHGVVVELQMRVASLAAAPLSANRVIDDGGDHPISHG